MQVAHPRQMIERKHSRLSIAAQCRSVSISRSSSYHALMTAIDAAFLAHPCYDSRQMARHRTRLGHAVGRRRVRRHHVPADGA